MNKTFKGKGTPEWTLTDEGITYKKKLYSFSQITDVTVFAVPKRGFLATNGVLQVFIEGTKVPLSLGYSFEETTAGEEAFKFIDNLKIFSLLANVADVKSLVIHPASTTHSQLSEEDLNSIGIHQSTIRLSIGTEHIDDIIDDLKNGFAAI